MHGLHQYMTFTFLSSQHSFNIYFIWVAMELCIHLIFLYFRMGVISYYLGYIYFTINMNVLNGFMEVPMPIQKLPVLYKHRDLCFYPSKAYTLPCWIFSIPSSLLEISIRVLFAYVCPCAMRVL